MKKIFNYIITIIIVLILIIAVSIKVYALTEEKEAFVTVESNNVEPNGAVNLNINLSDIPYSTYKIKLTSSDKIENMSITNAETNKEVEIKEEKQVQSSDTSDNSEIEFTISDISNLHSIVITYNVPENAQIGSTIILTITITQIESSVENTNVENNINNMTNKNTNTEIESNSNSMSCQITLNVVEDSEEDAMNKNNTNNEFLKDDNTINNKTETNMVSSNKTSMTTTSLTSTTSSQSKTNTETVTYNGSDDNYLTNISINGEDLSDFNTTKTTYFKNMDSSTTSVKITYDKSDSNATVCVYGNTDLKSGTNKILITVTAENGNTRTYRIYITI